MSPKRLSLAVLLVAGVVVGSPVFAQDDANGFDDRSDIYSLERAPKTVVWCQIQDGLAQKLYLSDAQPMKHPTRMYMGSLSGRFARVVNARYGMHLLTTANYCQSFHSTAASESARGTVIGNARKKNLTVVSISIF